MTASTTPSPWGPSGRGDTGGADAFEAERVRNLLATCVQLADSGRLDEWVELFTADGSLTVHGNTVQGHDALRRHVAGQRARHHAVKHLTTNSVVAVTGSSARACSDFVMVRQEVEDGPLAVALMGRFDDTFALVEGDWRLAARRVDI